MNARLQQFFDTLRETFWIVPALLVLAGIVAAFVCVWLDQSGLVPRWLVENAVVYNGGGTGARTLLGAVASSTIGVAGTVFSITIASLSLAAGQMGPRLLRNFTKDRGNQVTLGIFLGTFTYSLLVLRSVRTQEEGAFVPHLSLTIDILLAICCVGTLVYFVHHIASRINVDTVIDIVSDEVGSALERLTTDRTQEEVPPPEFWDGAEMVRDQRSGYLLQLDASGLGDWALKEGVALKLLVRPGDYVFPGAPIAFVTHPRDGTASAIHAATALGSQRVSSADLELAVRQLVEVAVRALSPGINDPNTAINVLDRLGAALCRLVELKLPSGVTTKDGKVVLVAPAVTYAGLLDSMFHMIRQNAAGSVAILIRMLEVLTATVATEGDAERTVHLRRHADLVKEDAVRSVSTKADLDDVLKRHAMFESVQRLGPAIALAGL